MILILKAETIRNKSLTRTDQEQLLQDVVDEVRTISHHNSWPTLISHLDTSQRGDDHKSEEHASRSTCLS